MKFRLVENSHLQKDKWVVVNIEPRLSSYARLVPVKVSFIPNDGKIQFFGWANGERQHEYSTSSIVYQASSEEDANDYIKSKKGMTVKELRSELKESLTPQDKLDISNYIKSCINNVYSEYKGDTEARDALKKFLKIALDYTIDEYPWGDDSGLEEDLTMDDDPEETEQQYSSAATSINSSKLPAVFKMVDFEKDSVNLDYGGGKFDNAAEYLSSQYGATNLVYDKYNRTNEHNREVLSQVRKNGGADTVTCSNVLNVIAEEQERLAVLRNCKRFLKPGGKCYITVYEGNSSGEGAPSKAGYQLNRKTKDYEDEIKQVFSSVKRRGKLFICQ